MRSAWGRRSMLLRAVHHGCVLRFAGLVLTAMAVACASDNRSSAPLESWTEPGTGMRFALVPAGSFLMGSPVGEAGREAQERLHAVTLTRSFWLGLFEVTQGEWRAVTGTEPSWFNGDATRPVENVTWLEIQDFLDRLSARSPGNRFRLPTEAEWEYACRAGTTTAFASGHSLDHNAANFAMSPERAAAGEGTTMPVGSFPANPWGFYDMHGNVWEWTSAEYCPYAEDAGTNPTPSCGASLKVIRGGSWYFGADSARCALRYTHLPDLRGFSLGFRVVRDSTAP